MFFYRFILLSVIFFTISACSSAPSVASAHYFRYFNFSNVASYAFYGRNDENFDYQNISDVMHNSIEIAIESELDKKAWMLKKLDEADLVVTYFWVDTVKDKIVPVKGKNKRGHRGASDIEKYKNIKQLIDVNELKHYNRGVRYCAECLKLSNMDNKSITINTAPGALIIDLIDPKSKRSVWRSSYPVIVKEKENSQEIQQRIQRAVVEMIKQYPKS
ncbi:MAG: hypothetical protein COB35_12000 [Gammaproteobacteria bacterium]|nr:MAG: hypothetical protein COB35_12000 [Gammaproteobacteria bacterium]